MKRMFNATFGIFLAFSVNTVAHAEVIEVEYKSFYSHVKKLSGEDTKALQFAFGFQHVIENRLCEITDVKIVTQKQTIDIDVTPENRFSMPTERALRLADAVVQIQTPDQTNQCDISVQLETKPEYLKQYYTSDELSFLYQQYGAFFNEMGSFLSFMMPQVSGLTFYFADTDLDHELRDAPAIVNGLLQLDAKWFEKPKTLVFPTPPQRITARTE